VFGTVCRYELTQRKVIDGVLKSLRSHRIDDHFAVDKVGCEIGRCGVFLRLGQGTARIKSLQTARNNYGRRAIFEEVCQNLSDALLLRPLAVGFSRMLAVLLQIGGARLDERRFCDWQPHTDRDAALDRYAKPKDFKGVTDGDV
jgi:hypothetical protein